MREAYLRKLINSVLDYHDRKLEARQPNIFIPVQPNLSDVFSSPTKRAISLGRYFEHITAGIYGGELNDLRYDLPFQNGFISGGVKPDVVDKETGLAWDSKACCSGHSCTLIDTQIWGYEYLQFLSQDMKFFFSLYRHDLKGIKSKWVGGEEDLINDLKEKNFFSLNLPFSVILALHRYDNNAFNLVYKYNYSENGRAPRNAYDSCTCIRSSTINLFLTEPKAVLRVLNLSDSDYEIKRYLSPVDLKINNVSIRQFPILWIKDKDHGKWVKDFSKDFSDNLKTIEDLVQSGDNDYPVDLWNIEHDDADQWDEEKMVIEGSGDLEEIESDLPF